MPVFVYRIQPTRPEMLTTGPTEEEAAAVQWHFEYLADLTNRGVVLLAGRTLTTDAESFGLVLFKADSEPAARELVSADPAVQAGVMRGRLFPYRVALHAAAEHWSGLE